MAKRALSFPQIATFLVVVLAPTSATAAPPTALVSLSATEFRAGDTLTAGIQAANPAGNPAADLYVGVVLADGITARFFLPGGSISPPITLTDPARFVPLRAAPPGFTLDAPAFFRVTLPATGVPPGTYRFFAALVRQGGLQDGRLDAGDALALDIRPSVFSPANTFLPFWRKPFDGEFRTTNVFDHNLPFEFTDTNGFLVTWWGLQRRGYQHRDGAVLGVEPARLGRRGQLRSARPPRRHRHVPAPLQLGLAALPSSFLM